MIRRRQKSCKGEVCSILIVLSVDNALLCMFQRVWTYFQDIKQYLYSGVCTFGALQQTANFCKKWRGTYFRRGTYLRGFTVISKEKKFLFSRRWRAKRRLTRSTFYFNIFLPCTPFLFSFRLWQKKPFNCCSILNPKKALVSGLKHRNSKFLSGWRWGRIVGKKDNKEKKRASKII